MRTWILQRYQTYARLVLLTGLFLSAIWFWRPTIDVFDLVKLTILWIMGLLALLLWVISSAERGVWVPKLKLFWFAAAFLAAQGLATIFSQDRWLSFLGLYHRYGGLLPFSLYATIALILVGLYWERPQDLKEIPRAMVLAALFVSGYVIIEKLGWDWIPWRDSSGNPPPYPVSTLGNSDFAGGWLAITAPLFLYVVITAKESYMRWILAVLMVAELAALWFTQARGAFIAFGFALAVLAFLYRDLAPRWVRRSAAAGVAAVFLIVILVLIHPGMKQAPGIFNVNGQFSFFRTGTLTSRSYYWVTALKIFQHHPVLGTGPDTYYANYPHYRLAKDGALLGLTITDKPHDIYLEYAANSGILGIGTYLALLGSALWFGYRRLAALTGHTRLLLTVFIASLAAYIGQGVFSIDIPPLAVLGWVCLAGIACLADPKAVAARDAIETARAAQTKGARPKKKKSGTAATKSRLPFGGLRVLRQGTTRWPWHATAFVLFLILIVIGVRPFWADSLGHNGQAAQSAMAAGQTGFTTDGVAAMFLHAAHFQPREPSYQSLAGSVYETAGDQAQSSDPTKASSWFNLALGRYQAALNLQPENVFYVMNLARIYTSWGGSDPTKFTLADTWWGKAEAIDPTDYQIHEQYANMLNAWANAEPTNRSLVQRTAGELQKAVTERPDQTTQLDQLAQVYLSLGDTVKAKAAATEALSNSPTDANAKSILATITATPATPTPTGTPTSTTSTSGG